MKFFGIAACLAACVLTAASASALEPRLGVHLRALDKITGNATDITARLGQTVKFGRISIVVRACYQSPPEDAPESEAFLEIRPLGAAQDKPLAELGHPKDKPQPVAAGADSLLFSGWMFASSPGLNALEHPVYDVWVISCTAAAPAPVAGAPAAPVAPVPPSAPVPEAPVEPSVQ